MANVVLYARSATGENNSLSKQLAECQRWAEQYHHIVLTRFSDVISGLADDPPAWNKAVTMAVEKGASIVVCDPSRVSRDLHKLQERQNVLKGLGVDLLFTTEVN